MPEPNTNGRVSTRDVLEAVNASEERITHRIDRLEERVERKWRDHDTRLVNLETALAIDTARNRGIIATVAGIKGFVLVAVAVLSVVIGAVGLAVAIEAKDVSASSPVEIVTPD